MTLRDLTSIDDCRLVVDVEREVWGEDAEIVPASVLAASAKRGGILVGASEGDRLLGFVWSMPGLRDGRRSHWSHMMAVRPDARGRGLGVQLKLAQRDRALAQDVDLIEWTFDPLQAQNAYLNCAELGATATTYLVDAYGPMTGRLHAGLPTDRLVAEWHLRTPHVERRLAALASPARLIARSAEVSRAIWALRMRSSGAAADPIVDEPDSTAERLLVAVPPAFTGMCHDDPSRAMAWRLAAREVFTRALGGGYKVVDFRRDEPSGGGHYVLARIG